MNPLPGRVLVRVASHGQAESDRGSRVSPAIYRMAAIPAGGIKPPLRPFSALPSAPRVSRALLAGIRSRGRLGLTKTAPKNHQPLLSFFINGFGQAPLNSFCTGNRCGLLAFL